MRLSTYGRGRHTISLAVVGRDQISIAISSRVLNSRVNPNPIQPAMPPSVISSAGCILARVQRQRL